MRIYCGSGFGSDTLLEGVARALILLNVDGVVGRDHCNYVSLTKVPVVLRVV
jgi:hypothetical protein